MRKNKQGGYTLLEVMVVGTMVVPLLGALMATSNSVSGSVATNEEAAEVRSSVNRSFDRLEQMLRGAHLSTIKTKAVQEDVTKAQNLMPPDETTSLKTGDWSSPDKIEGRKSLQITVARSEGDDRHRVTEERSIDFVMDQKELDNDRDDDGDGLVDEGRLVVGYGSKAVVLARGVEDFSLDLDGRLLRLRIRCARKDKSGRVHRASYRRNILVRNN